MRSEAGVGRRRSNQGYGRSLPNQQRRRQIANREHTERVSTDRELRSLASMTDAQARAWVRRHRSDAP